ncbi:MAG: hypothetical protein JHC61_00570 [Burkholderiaceae bacterium]|nr:hypothetical protein [Burkholderiaceae bacterium]
MSTGYLVMYGVFSAILIALVWKIVRSFEHKRSDDVLASRHRRASRASWRGSDPGGHRGSGVNGSAPFTYAPLAGGGYHYSGGTHEASKTHAGTVVHTIGGGAGDGPDGHGSGSSGSAGGAGDGWSGGD